jgi:hypothetical protein
LTDLCTHLISSGNLEESTFVLVNTSDAHAFTCTQCACDWTEGVLLSQPIHATARALVFTACDHGDHGHVCRTCLASFRDALTARWSRAMVTDKRMANRLMRLRRMLAKNYDAGSTPAAHKARRQAAKLPAYPNANILGRAGDVGRLGQRWTANRNQRLATLRPPVHSIVVVHP